MAVVGLDERQTENQDALSLTTHLVKDRDLPAAVRLAVEFSYADR